MRSNAYRPEIEGLRAIAVGAVVLFHVRPEWLKGGFAGVDVFFVISGFLITSIIVRQSDAGTFSFKEFWLRRVRRLFPALAIVLAFTFVVGYLTLFGEQWVSLGSQTVSVLLLIGNFEMWQIANDYWGQAAEDVPLLHTWSLAVEEQFYLLYPLCLFILMKSGRRFVLPVLILALVASLALSIYGTPRWPAAMFYLLPARAWELLIGCVLGVIQTRRARPLSEERLGAVVAFVGLVAVVISVFIMDGTRGFPGYQALLPTIGTGVILAFTDSRQRVCLTTRILSLPPIIYLGRISYSLYLWHWPLLVYSQWYDIHPFWVVAVSIAMASLSYHIVETPFRTKVSLTRYVPVAAALLFAAALPIHYDKVSPQGLPEELSFVASPEAATRGRAFEAKNLIDQGGVLIGGEPDQTPELVVIGSSHARMFGQPFSEYALETDTRLSMLGCANLGITDLESPLARARLALLEKWKPSVVVVAGRWEAEMETRDFERSLRAVLPQIASHSRHCIVLSQVPLIQTNARSGKNLKKFIVTEYRRTDHLPELKEDSAYLKANRTVASIVESLNIAGLQFLPLGEPLLHDGSIQFIKEGKLLYDDHNHLNHAGVRWVFDQSIRPMLDRAKNIAE